MIECILFYLNMIAQTQKNLISPVCDKNAAWLLRISGFNMKVLKFNLTEFCIFFYNFQMSTVTASGNELSLKISMPYRG